MPTIIRFNKRRYVASGVNLTELFDQIPEPIAYFDADNRLGACNLSFRDHFPIVIESEFLKRASTGPVSSQSTSGTGSPARLLPPGGQPVGRKTPVSLPATITTAKKSDFAPDIRKTPDGGTLLTCATCPHQHRMEDDYRKRMDVLMAELAAAHRGRQEAVDAGRQPQGFSHRDQPRTQDAAQRHPGLFGNDHQGDVRSGAIMRVISNMPRSSIQQRRACPVAGERPAGSFQAGCRQAGTAVSSRSRSSKSSSIACAASEPRRLATISGFRFMSLTASTGCAATASACARCC